MTIECYLALCPEHSIHEEGPEAGPFCFHERCIQSDRYLKFASEFQAKAIEQQKQLKAVPLRPVVMHTSKK